MVSRDRPALEAVGEPRRPRGLGERTFLNIMRALGPGSVSSLLKVVLDVVRWALWAAAGLVSVTIVAVLLLSFKPELLNSQILIEEIDLHGPWVGPVIAATLLGADLYLAGAILIVGRLRRIFLTLIAGDPFHPDNVPRLQMIAATLAALEVGRYVFAPLLRLATHGGSRLHLTGSVSLTAWFSVLVIVVLAEVFREGARLRSEAELTI
jgi:hypothetical protein